MKWGRASHAALMALSAMAGRVSALTSQKASAERSGPVTLTAPMGKPDVLPQLEAQIAQLRGMKRHDPRRGQLHRAIYSARHDILRGGHARG